jgi:hypothetical protein
VYAQNRVEVGVFLDYIGITQTNTNNFGVGGRFGYRVHDRVMMEGELAYDYGIKFNETFRNIATADIAAIAHTSIGVTHGLFGPTFAPARERFRPFVTLKTGLWIFVLVQVCCRRALLRARCLGFVRRA